MTPLYPFPLRRRGGRRKLEKRENCTFDTCVVGRSSFAKWRVPLWRFVSVASFPAITALRQFSNWSLSSLHSPYFIAPLPNNGGNSNCRVHFGRRVGWLGRKVEGRRTGGLDKRVVPRLRESCLLTHSGRWARVHAT